jgi:segregation and condensation protein A
MTPDEAGVDAPAIIGDAALEDADAVARANHGPMGGEAGPASDEEPNAVVEHLLLHRSLADHDPDRLAEYLEMARSEVASFRDPFDRAIALTFTLVLDEEMDPWSIDLATFSELYTDRVRETPEVDLITGGRLLAMAWNVLLAQTDALLARAEEEDDEEDPEPGWEDPMFEDLPQAWDEPVEQDPDEQYTEHVLDEDNDPPITESVFNQGERRVTLYELVDALEEGRREAERRKRLNEERRKAREELEEDEPDDEEVTEEVHEEDLEAEIHDVRQRLQDLENGEETRLARVHDGSRDDFLTVFVSSLFLSRARMIDVRQEEFPYSPILVTPRDPLHDPDAPLVGLPSEAQADLDEETEADEGASPEADADEADEDPAEADAVPQEATP